MLGTIAARRSGKRSRKMKWKIVVALLFVAALFVFAQPVVAAPLPPTVSEQITQNAGCSGQYVVYNYSWWIVEVHPVNDWDKALDIPPWAEPTKGHIAPNQPVEFVLYGEFGEGPSLGTVSVHGCDFGGDLRVYVNPDPKKAGFWVPAGFRKY